MLALGPLAFLSPWLLAGLLALPLIALLLRVLPPSPKRALFPPVEILRRAQVTPPRSSTVPWWLMALRLLALALIILAVARPVWNPNETLSGSGPILAVLDDGWASAPNFEAGRQELGRLLDQAEREGRSVALLTTAAAPGAEPPVPREPAVIRQSLNDLGANAWPVDRGLAAARLDRSGIDAATVVWLSDGVLANPDSAGDFEELASRLRALGPVTLVRPSDAQLATLISTPREEGQAIEVTVERAAAVGEGEGQGTTALLATDGEGGVLARAPVTWDEGERLAQASVALPGGLAAQVRALELEPRRSAGDVVLLDTGFGRKRVGIVEEGGAPSPLLSESFFVERALSPFAEVDRGDLATLVEGDASVLVMPDRSLDGSDDLGRIEDWIDAGGVLIRFAGSSLAASPDPLLPVPLRQGERYLGGALSWTQPLPITRFASDGPFADLPPAPDALVRRQVLAEPGPTLSRLTLASLSDGTPIVTGRPIGGGWLILVHTSANTSWSDLPLSGVFVEMLARAVQLARGTAPDPEARWALAREIDASGRLVAPSNPERPVIEDAAFEEAVPSPATPPGVYADAEGETAEDGQAVGRVLPLQRGVRGLEPLPEVQGATARGYEAVSEVRLASVLLTLALLLILAETAASAWLRGLVTSPRGWWGGGGLRGRAKAGAAALLLAAGVWALAPSQASAQDDGFGLPPFFGDDFGGFAPERSDLEGGDQPADLAGVTRLAYVRTGAANVDQLTEAGLRGLSLVTERRTSVSLGEPIGVDLATDDLAFFPLIYWSVRPDHPDLPPAALDALERYLRTGGLVLIDTADAAVSLPGLDAQGPGAGRLSDLLAGADLPPLVPLPADHVLTRSFYLLQEQPGRASGGTVWVDRPQEAVNDGVSGLVIGSNDWAGAWAVDEYGSALLPVSPGSERQREMARRFGVNLVIYALTGNYKTDQVHVPALLERLGQ